MRGIIEKLQSIQQDRDNDDRYAAMCLLECVGLPGEFEQELESLHTEEIISFNLYRQIKRKLEG